MPGYQEPRDGGLVWNLGSIPTLQKENKNEGNKNTTKEVGVGWGRCLCSQCELGAGWCPLTLSLLLPLQDNQLGVMKELGKGGGYGCSNAMKTPSGV